MQCGELYRRVLSRLGFYLQLHFSFVLKCVDQLPHVLIRKHGSHGSRDRPEQIRADPRVKGAPTFLHPDCLTGAEDAGVSGSIGHPVG